MAEEVKDYPPYLDYPKPRKRQTNADRIRAMTDEYEMAKVMLQLHRKANGYTDTMLGLVELLKQEVSDNG
jgi:hypothetical protein